MLLSYQVNKLCDTLRFLADFVWFAMIIGRLVSFQTWSLGFQCRSLSFIQRSLPILCWFLMELIKSMNHIGNKNWLFTMSKADLVKWPGNQISFPGEKIRFSTDLMILAGHQCRLIAVFILSPPKMVKFVHQLITQTWNASNLALAIVQSWNKSTFPVA